MRHLRARMHTYTNTRIHEYTNTRIHDFANTHTNKYTNTHTNTHIIKLTITNTPKHKTQKIHKIHKRTNAQTHKHTHKYTHIGCGGTLVLSEPRWKVLRPVINSKVSGVVMVDDGR